MKFAIELLFLLFITTLSAERIQLSCGQIRHFVDGHNMRRQMVARGLVPRQPASSNMKSLVWDEELAAKAADWAETVKLIHNPDRTVASNRWDIIGENIYLGKSYTPLGMTAKPNIEEALHCWFGENSNYYFSPYTMDSYDIGHYTQMVWANTTRFGCGISKRRSSDEWTEIMYVCNYGPAGNFVDHFPYKRSRRRGSLLCGNKGGCKKPYGTYCSANIRNTYRYY